jgi:hypothetical protein
MGIILEGSPSDRKVARKLADMASDASLTYTPTGYVVRCPGKVWHEMTCTSADGRKWTYYLRLDSGSYAGTFEV